jgi:hypothetical protein
MIILFHDDNSKKIVCIDSDTYILSILIHIIYTQLKI